MFLESSLQDLYQSTIAAFPHCGLRQHATHPIVIKNLTWVPFLGLKTLFIKSLAQNEEREYNPILLFKNVNYNGNEVLLTASDGKQYNFDRISLENSDVLVRCNCKDFSYRFNFYNHLDKSLYGRKRAKYESKGGPPANPTMSIGMCKHLIKLSHVLKEADLFL